MACGTWWVIFQGGGGMASARRRMLSSTSMAIAYTLRLSRIYPNTTTHKVKNTIVDSLGSKGGNKKQGFVESSTIRIKPYRLIVENTHTHAHCSCQTPAHPSSHEKEHHAAQMELDLVAFIECHDICQSLWNFRPKHTLVRLQARGGGKSTAVR